MYVLVHLNLKFFAGVVPTCDQPRLCSRACLLILLATVRGVYICLEQPMTSMMRFYPDLVATGEAISQHLGVWKQQNLSDPYDKHGFFTTIGIQRSALPSFMGSWGSPTLKPSRAWSTACVPQSSGVSHRSFKHSWLIFWKCCTPVLAKSMGGLPQTGRLQEGTH